MGNANKAVRILKCDSETLAQSKDEEYRYWQSRPPVERLEAMLELSFAFFEGRGNEAETRRQFLRSPVCLPDPLAARTNIPATK